VVSRYQRSICSQECHPQHRQSHDGVHRGRDWQLRGEDLIFYPSMGGGAATDAQHDYRTRVTLVPEADPAERDQAGRMLLGRALRERRSLAGFNLDELASRSGLSSSYISDVERGRKLISLTALDAYARALGTLATDLLDGVYPYGEKRRPRRLPKPLPDGRAGRRMPSRIATQPEQVTKERPAKRTRS
jgi:transcriptional regulator with XRE-family HTH domain